MGLWITAVSWQAVGDGITQKYLVFTAEIWDFLKKQLVFFCKKSRILDPKKPWGVLLGGLGDAWEGLERPGRARGRLDCVLVAS